LEMSIREISAHHLRPQFRIVVEWLHPVPAAGPLRIGEEAVQRFGIKITLAGEMAIEAAMGEAGILHDGADRDAVETVVVEELAGRFDDPGSCLPGMIL